jgi:aquaporin NIP
MLKGTYIKEFCEFLGVALLCFLVIGVSVFANRSQAEGSIFAGSVVMLIIYGIGNISGAHINPAVSLGFFASRRFNQGQFFRYIAAQFLGSILALGALLVAFGRDYNWAAAAPHINTPFAFIVEILMTGLLVFTIFSVATGDCRICPEARPIAGVVIGTAIASLSYFGGSLGVGVLNPAVPFVFAIVAGTWLELLKFLVAASIGAVLAAFLYQLTRSGTSFAKKESDIPQVSVE